MGFQLWIEEHDKAVWHLVTERITPRTFRVACGWRMTPTDTRIYPQKRDDPGPPAEDRCRTCVGEEPAAIAVDVPTGAANETE